MRSGVPSFHGNPLNVCRHGDCMKQGYGRPPLCPDHQRQEDVKALEPSSFAPPTKAQLTAGSARVARGRR